MYLFFVLVAIALSSSTSFTSATAVECVALEAGTNFSISLIKNAAGDDWLSSFYAEKYISESANKVDMKLEHSVARCGKGRVMRIRGVMRDAVAVSSAEKSMSEGVEQVSSSKTNEPMKSNDEDGVLRFSDKKGRNADLVNDGRTAYRKNPLSERYYATLVTNRPLKDEELFEVMVHTIVNPWKKSSFVIGVTVSPPADIESLQESYSLKNGTWVLVISSVKHDASIIKGDYGLNMESLKDGDRVGVQVRSNGSLHFYLNGKDGGLAASHVSTPVYGIVDLIHYIGKISLVG